MSKFEDELEDLLERTKSIKPPINAGAIGTNINEYNRPSEDWINDVEIFYNKYLKEHSLGKRIDSLLFHRGLTAYSDLVSCLNSIRRDTDFIDKMNGISTIEVPVYKAKTLPEFDVFLSHANKDKTEIVDDLIFIT